MNETSSQQFKLKRHQGKWRLFSLQWFQYSTCLVFGYTFSFFSLEQFRCWVNSVSNQIFLLVWVIVWFLVTKLHLYLISALRWASLNTACYYQRIFCCIMEDTIYQRSSHHDKYASPARLSATSVSNSDTWSHWNARSSKCQKPVFLCIPSQLWLSLRRV